MDKEQENIKEQQSSAEEIEEREAVESEISESSEDVLESAKEQSLEAQVETVESEEKTDKTRKKTLQGLVASNKGDKTIVVRVERLIAHPLYKKYYKRAMTFMAHDEGNDCNIGDTVKIIESKPRSARKRWDLQEIVERAK